MHASSFALVARFRATYIPSNQYQVDNIWRQVSVLDVGAANHIWNYSGVFGDCEYKTLEPEYGGAPETAGNSDYMVNGYDWSNLKERQFNSWDVVVCGQVLEHDPKFWQTCTNIGNAVNSGGYAFIIVPSKGHIHRFPVDCYRFLPDAAEVFAEYAGMKIIEVSHNPTVEWGDLGVVLKKLS